MGMSIVMDQLTGLIVSLVVVYPQTPSEAVVWDWIYLWLVVASSLHFLTKDSYLLLVLLVYLSHFPLQG